MKDNPGKLKRSWPIRAKEDKVLPMAAFQPGVNAKAHCTTCGASWQVKKLGRIHCRHCAGDSKVVLEGLVKAAKKEPKLGYLRVHPSLRK